MIFFDDFTRYTWLFPSYAKSDVLNVFHTFKLQIENLFSLKIKTFRSDGGGEFMSNQFQRLLQTNGIVHQISYAYTPEQNGCAERKHRNIVETGLALLFKAHMPAKFWVDAFLNVVYLINRMPMQSLRFSSYWATLCRHPSDYSSLKVFG